MLRKSQERYQMQKPLVLRLLFLDMRLKVLRVKRRSQRLEVYRQMSRRSVLER